MQGGGIACVSDGDVVIAVEAFAFLVAVQGGAGGCDGLAAVFRRDREKVADFAVFDGKEAGGYLLFPGGLDEPPAGLGFHNQVTRKGRALELENLVGEDDFSGAGGGIRCVEADRQFAVADDVKSIDDVIEAVFDRGLK